MLYGLLVSLHLVVSVILILVVLLQTGKGADLAGAFGGGGSQTAFGSRGAATILSKLTTTAAVLFMLTSFTLALMSARGSGSVLDSTEIPAATAPAPPATGNSVPEVEAAVPAQDTAGNEAAEAMTDEVPPSEPSSDE